MTLTSNVLHSPRPIMSSRPTSQPPSLFQRLEEPDVVRPTLPLSNTFLHLFDTCTRWLYPGGSFSSISPDTFEGGGTLRVTTPGVGSRPTTRNPTTTNQSNVQLFCPTCYSSLVGPVRPRTTGETQISSGTVGVLEGPYCRRTSVDGRKLKKRTVENGS